MKLILCFLLCIYTSHYASAQFGDAKQSFGYIDVREGCHTFYWLFYSMAAGDDYTERPLMIWLQGGPGGSSVGYGNFEILGPLDLALRPRADTWANSYNLLLIDNPIGTGFSYVDDLSLLTTTNEQIGEDLLNFMRGFYEKHPEFESVPLFVYGQSYGGKMAVDFAIALDNAIKEGTITSNFKGFAMGNAWISPVDSVIGWAPLLESTGLVDSIGAELIDAQAQVTKDLFDQGEYNASTTAWAVTQRVVLDRTFGVDFYNILTKRYNPAANSRLSDLELARRMFTYQFKSAEEEYELDYLMNNVVKPALGVPESVTWGGQSGPVFQTLRVDFMKPVTEKIDYLLNNTDVLVVKYNGNMDLICGTLGQKYWVEQMTWAQVEEYKVAPREPIWVNNLLEGYVKKAGNFKFYWVNVAGHSAPLDNPAAIGIMLEDMSGTPYVPREIETNSGHGLLASYTLFAVLFVHIFNGIF